MKTLLILILLFSISCKKDDPNTVEEQIPVASGPYKETPAATSEVTTKLSEFMKIINDHRISIGVQPLIHDEQLGDVAFIHSSDMATGMVAFGHGGFSERCAEGRSILRGGNLCGENVAMGQKTVQAAFTAWMNSSGHRANIEQGRYTHTGFGFAKSSNGTFYWTQIFLESK